RRHWILLWQYPARLKNWRAAVSVLKQRLSSLVPNSERMNSNHGGAAVDVQDLSRHVRGRPAGEEECHAGDLVGLSEAAQGQMAGGALQAPRVGTESPCEIGFHEAGGRRLTPDGEA